MRKAFPVLLGASKKKSCPCLELTRVNNVLYTYLCSKLIVGPFALTISDNCLHGKQPPALIHGWVNRCHDQVQSRQAIFLYTVIIFW